MKTTPILLTLSALLLCPATLASTLPKGDVCVPGSTLQPLSAADYEGHLLPAMQDYLWCLRFNRHELKTYRHAAFDVARRFPAEVNDLLQRSDGSWATPLSMAVQAQDAELTDLLLHLGALPFGPNAAYPLNELPPMDGVTPDPKVKHLLHQAQKGYNPLATILQNARGTAAKKPLNEPPSARLSPTLRLLEETNENRYLCEPGFEEPRRLYLAFNHLGAAQSTLLRVQPLSCIIVQPEENAEKGHGLYGSIITTGRVVNALKGAIPPQEFITWEVPHEGPIDEARVQAGVGEGAAPVFFSIDSRRLAAATAEENHLKIGRMDGFDIFRGAEWQGIFERVLADYPEREEPLAATPEDLAAARQLIEEESIIVRATVVRVSAKVDEAAGQVQLRYLATLRDPLKGAIIKGALRDWGNIEYHRSFPLTEEWRQFCAELQAGTRSNCIELPVILTLEATDKAEESCWVDAHARQPMKLRRMFDARHEAPMFRAINETAFCPLWSSTH